MTSQFRGMAAILAVSLVLLQAPSTHADGPTRSVQYPGVTVLTYAAPPLEASVPEPAGCDRRLCLPQRIVLRNISGRSVARAWVMLSFPETGSLGTPLGLFVGLNTEVGSAPALLAPDDRVTLEVLPAQVDALDRALRQQGRSLASLTQLNVLVTHVDFEDGTYFVPPGHSPRGQ